MEKSIGQSPEIEANDWENQGKMVEFPASQVWVPEGSNDFGGWSVLKSRWCMKLGNVEWRVRYFVHTSDDFLWGWNILLLWAWIFEWLNKWAVTNWSPWSCFLMGIPTIFIWDCWWNHAKWSPDSQFTVPRWPGQWSAGKWRSRRRRGRGWRLPSSKRLSSDSEGAKELRVPIFPIQ